MSAPEVVIVQTGTANLASVLAGLHRAGGRARTTESPAEIERAPFVVLPGVGAFAAGLERLRARDLVGALRQRIADQCPTLAICLGLQLLAQESDESANEAGIGAFEGRVTRFPDGTRTPQLGWNLVRPDADCATVREGHAYFANSYRLVDAPPGWAAAYADHGGRFVAALERGPVLACQFHPELSSAYGRELLQRWLGGAPC